MRKKFFKRILLVLSFAMIALVYTGCRNRDSNQSDDNMGQTDQEESTGAESNTGTDPDSQDDDGILDDMGDAADDVADDVGDAIDDMTGVDFGDYDSANQYLFTQLGNNGRYVVRNEDKELKNYDSSDSSRMGYRYEVYDSSDEESTNPYGVFYVDQQTGKIYRENQSGSGVEEYQSEQ